jgi:transcriptional regulator of aromatic amino acid metabolism
MLQATCNEVDTHPLLILWLSSQRPQQHFLLRCDPGRFDSVAAQATMFGVPPVRLRRYPGNLVLPPDKKGTLLLNDIDLLSLPDQIGLYDWLGSGAGDLRVISIATSSLAERVARGAFLEGLFHRLGAVQFDLRTEEFGR